MAVSDVWKFHMENDWNNYVVTHYSINVSRDSIELNYARVPSVETRNRLKSDGWKWSSYYGVWYKKYSEEALQFAKLECALTEKRKMYIERMPAFYRSHCGYSEEELLRISKPLFDRVAKYGTLSQIAKSLLMDTLPDASLSYLAEIYLRAFRDEKYRDLLIKKIPQNVYQVSSSGKYSLRDEKADTSPATVLDDNWLSQFQLKQTKFWETLSVFGRELRPIDRTAYAVSNYRNSYISSTNSDYLHPTSRKEYHLFKILASLTVDYDDLLVRTIKNDLRKELDIIIRCDISDPDYYLLAIYAYIIGNMEYVSKFLDAVIEHETAKGIILKSEKQFKKYSLT